MRHRTRYIALALVILAVSTSCRYNKIMAEADPTTEAEVTKEEIKEGEVDLPGTRPVD